MERRLNVFYYTTFINGQKYNLYIKKYSNLSNLINFLQPSHNKKFPIIEHNGQITNFLNTIYLKNNDKLEIITIVGGG